MMPTITLILVSIDNDGARQKNVRKRVLYWYYGGAKIGRVCDDGSDVGCDDSDDIGNDKDVKWLKAHQVWNVADRKALW